MASVNSATQVLVEAFGDIGRTALTDAEERQPADLFGLTRVGPAVAVGLNNNMRSLQLVIRDRIYLFV